ncbi:MAG: UvrD-helicase domain-containing protein [Bacteroidaceae bacterium]|nr:UvrD-helicase domain-containing protein [Bacteroidaceae bacterium]
MEEHSKLTLYKASAGSGKTFMLAVRYISFLARNPQAYRSILAVTFTNKATAEMKQRIMSQLYGISRGLSASESYFSTVRKLVPQSVSDSQIRENAGRALSLILQDYGHFRVETIDSFLQSILRGVARELQLGSNLSIELDVKKVIGNAVDALLTDISQKSDELRHVMTFIQDNIDNDKGWHIDKSLKEFSEQLFNEDFMLKSGGLEKALDKPDTIREYSALLKEKRDGSIERLTDDMRRCGTDLTSALNGRGISVDSINSNAGKLIVSIADGVFLTAKPGKTLQKSIDEPASIFKKGQLKDDPGLESFAADITAPLFRKAQEIWQEYDYTINSTKAALSHLNELALLMAVRREINRIDNEEDTFVLADTAHLLSELTENDTSFVFEKTGSFIRHLMIDEFQDTSRMQWNNLGLLIHECLSQNEDCLVVGDVKQSIYRWRNSDWNILNSEIEQKFATYHPETVPLVTNRRSSANVIDFNNRLFPLAAECVSGIYRDMFGESHATLGRAYGDVIQEIPLHRNGSPLTPGGSVRVRLLRESPSGTDKEELRMEMIADELDRLTNAGVRQGDITMLFRGKKEIGKVAAWFAANRPEYRMVSGEAFQLDSSTSVRILVNVLKWLADDSDQVALAALLYEWKNEVLHEESGLHTIMTSDPLSLLPDSIGSRRETLRNIPMYELTEYLFRAFGLGGSCSQDAYVLSFLDTVKEYSSRVSPDISDFIQAWDERLHENAIPAENADSISLMTIHKSKGLEFNTVILPYCDWPLTRSGGNLWCEAAEAPYNGMALLPIEYASSLGNSVFSADYREETGRQLVDNLNLLYVAMTRPKLNLVMLSTVTPGKTATRPQNISDVISCCITTDRFVSHITDDGVLEADYGEITLPEKKSQEFSGNPFDEVPSVESVQMLSFGIRASFKQSGDSQKFVHSVKNDAEYEYSTQDTYIENGKLLHQLLSGIACESDIDREVGRMLAQGLMESREKAASISRLLHKAIAAPLPKRWFDGHWTLFNEASVLFRNGDRVGTRRPDRVMTDGSETIVVDFKFGRENEEHMHQVQEYMELLGRMGFNNIRGYVWYVYSGKTIIC